MDAPRTMDRKKPYERPQVSRVVIDLLQEMLQACGGTTTGKNSFPNPPCQGGPGS
jgi:hypothetical protein